ncbi:MAG: carboxymuconolactone decarboxylase family protein [Holdemanella sp.]|nr:carboxymuconolactone decarboxylase family protein [Holdemanella sp.]
MYEHFESEFDKTDPEYMEIINHFAYDEVIHHGTLVDDKTRFLCILSTLMGCQAMDLYEKMLPAAINFGLTPIEIKEIVYQGTDYLGMARIYPFLKITNRLFEECKIVLPLEGQSTTTPENRLEKGAQAQIDIFGQGMKDFYKTGPEEKVHINRWLAANCFGDYYTRTGLDYAQRELITFCMLSAQGGCEPQLTSHAKANMNMGNTREFLIEVVSQCLPYIGYPRSLNALTCIENAAKG